MPNHGGLGYTYILVCVSTPIYVTCSLLHIVCWRGCIISYNLSKLDTLERDEKLESSPWHLKQPL